MIIKYDDDDENDIRFKYQVLYDNDKMMTTKWMTTLNQSLLVATIESDFEKEYDDTKIIIMKSHPVARFAQERRF